MRYVRLTIETRSPAIHPMQAFLVESDAVRRERMVSWNTSDPEHDYLLFHVEGERAPYETALESTESIVEFDLTPIDDDSFYVYVTESPRPEDEAFKALFEETSLMLIPPVEYAADATIRMTVGGEQADLTALVEGMPDAMDVAVEGVGEYDHPHPTLVSGLTEKQRAAIDAAVDVGYYAVPREGGVEDVADVLDCAPSTASDHLRKAEATVMRHAADWRSA